MRLAVSLYQPKWTQDIHDEWMRNVLSNRPDLAPSQLERTRDLMNKHGGDCLVHRYRHLMPTLTLPDPNDRHVLAAAIAAHAPLIVTFNLTDFPLQTLAAFGTQAVHPDNFATNLYLQNSLLFIAQVQRHRQALVNPPKTTEEYLATLERCGLPKTVAQLQVHAVELD